MAIVPAGNPAWVRSVDHTDYGGHTDKINWHSQGVVNPRTDVGADQLTRMAADLAALTRTAPLATITYLNNDTGTAAPTIESINMMTAVRFTSYEGDAAPTGLPAGTRIGDGDVRFDFPATLTDDYGVSGTVHIVGAVASVQATGARIATVELLDNDADGSNNESVRVRVFDAAGAPITDQRVTLSVITGAT